MNPIMQSAQNAIGKRDQSKKRNQHRRNIQRKVEMKIYQSIALDQMKRAPQAEAPKMTEGKTAGAEMPK